MNASQNRYKETCFMYSNTEGHEYNERAPDSTGGGKEVLCETRR